MIDSWSRRDDETDAAWRAVSYYLSLGPKRSLDQVGRILYPDDGRRTRGKVGCIDRWSLRFRWVARVRDYERHRVQTGQRPAAACVNQS